jgi:oligopeptide transport system permease protein
MAGLIVVAVFLVVALLAPIIAPYSPRDQDYAHVFEGPSPAHWFGTDQLGRDWFSWTVHGARVSMTVGIFAQIVILLIAIPVGTIAGSAGGRVDNLLMRFADLTFAFPDLLLIILLRTWLGGSIFNIFLAIGIVAWVTEARLIRGQVLSLREQEFVTAARALGASHLRIMWRHLLPNALGPIIVAVTFGIPRAIFAEAALSFIGIGVEPGTPSWGAMVSDGRAAIFAYPHLVIFPAIAIALVMLAFTFLGDGLRDALDPRLQESR